MNKFLFVFLFLQVGLVKAEVIYAEHMETEEYSDYLDSLSGKEVIDLSNISLLTPPPSSGTQESAIWWMHNGANYRRQQALLARQAHTFEDVAGVDCQNPEGCANEEDGTVNFFDLFVDPITIDGSCLDYCFEGTCFWLDCNGFPPSCSIKTTLKVSHRNPDFVVSSFPTVGKNPWKEFTFIWGDIQKSMAEAVISWIGSDAMVGGGEGVATNSSQGGGDQTNSTTYREVDVVGYFYDFAMLLDELYCYNNTEALTPYYSSAFDGYLWRLGLTDAIYTPLIFTESIGIPYLKEWGSMYWRTGFIKQLNPAKANAVLSMRATSIASTNGEARVYIPATGNPNNSGQKFFKTPSPTKADGSDGSVWQMIHPKNESSCMIFDEIADSEGAVGDTWANGRWSNNQSSSVYNVWRPYECCKKKGQSYLFSVDVQICL